nr:uncharacterized mitochondrial protein AtMg00810-like [Tanacetum cinerariifolium]
MRAQTGIVVRNKARLVAQGYRQEEGIEYDEVFAPVARIKAIRPDIMFAVCAYSIFQLQLKVSHMYAVKRIFRYLKGEPTLGLWYPKDSPLEVIAYSDSDYPAASLDRKSTTRGYQFLCSRLISWQCKKQTIVANSTTKAEYISASNCYGQVLWLQNQLLDYGYNFMQTKIYVDNESVICVLQALVYLILRSRIKGRLKLCTDLVIDTQVIKGTYDEKFLTTAGIRLELKGYLINDGYVDLVQHAGVYFNTAGVFLRQTTTGKELSNPLMAGNLPKTTLPTKAGTTITELRAEPGEARAGTTITGLHAWPKRARAYTLSPDYVPGLEEPEQAPLSPDYVPGPKEPEQGPPSLVYLPYVLEPVYPEYMPPVDDVFPAEEQLLPVAATPTANSPVYIPEFDPNGDPEEDEEEDPKEDHADYLADFTVVALPAVDHVPSEEVTELLPQIPSPPLPYHHHHLITLLISRFPRVFYRFKKGCVLLLLLLVRRSGRVQ